MTALVGYAPFETERKKIALHKKKHLAEYFFLTAIKSTPHRGTKLQHLKFHRDIFTSQ